MGNPQHGYSYVVALFAVAILSIIALRAVENTLTNERREKEAELILVGQAYRDAIRNYYENSPGTFKTYPEELSSLLLDERTTTVRRPLRKLYRDPITGNSEWGIIRTDDGKVMGVYSLSDLKPVKLGNFPSNLTTFAAARTYRDWKFVYKPN